MSAEGREAAFFRTRKLNPDNTLSNLHREFHRVVFDFGYPIRSEETAREVVGSTTVLSDRSYVIMLCTSLTQIELASSLDVRESLSYMLLLL